TNFPRVVILIDNGVMPADEMMANVTRPIEEAMKDIPGTVNIRSATSRGSAEVNVFFDWSANMPQAELYVLGRLSEIRSTLPATATTQVHRLTFTAFPIIGISLTSSTRNAIEVWETARYDIYPRFLRIPGVARVNLVGGRVPEFHVVVDPVRVKAQQMTLVDIDKALAETNQFTPVGMQEENYQLYLVVVDDRLRTQKDIEDAVVGWRGPSPVRVRDIGIVERGAAPAFNRVTADGKEAVLLNVYGQPNSNTVQIARDLQQELVSLKHDLPPGMKLSFFYDQSQFVNEGVRSVWEAIIIGLGLAIVVLFLFLKSGTATFAAASVVPAIVLMTLVGIRQLGMSFNLMTLGGIAAAVGLIIDDAIVVVEVIYAKVRAGFSAIDSAALGIKEVGPALVGSTLTPVVVFIPLAFLDGVSGVFFRELALTIVIALLLSLVLAVTWTPIVCSLLMRRPAGVIVDEMEQGGPILRLVIRLYSFLIRRALRFPRLAALALVLFAAVGVLVFRSLDTDFLPQLDEGAFVIDYYSRPGTSLTETNRMLMHVEELLNKVPEISGFSRRTGARLALAIAEPNTGDFLVKLKEDRTRTTTEVIDEVRDKLNAAEPALAFEFPGVLSDLIGDLTWSPDPVEIKLFSSDENVLQKEAAKVAKAIESIPGVVDVNDGLVVAGPSLRIRTDVYRAARAGLTPKELATEIQTSTLGTVSSYVLQGDRRYDVRVVAPSATHESQQGLESLSIRSSTGADETLRDLAHIDREPGMLELHREDLRQLVAVSARFSGIDLGHGIDAIKHDLAKNVKLPPGATIEFGGLYQQQQQSFRNLALVLVMAIILVFAVLLVEFRRFAEPFAIVTGSVLALSGAVVAFWLTGTTLNIISLLGAIIGLGITAKNGILMLDFVDHLRARGMTLADSVIQSGARRLRPVLMTSMTAFLGLLPLAYGVGAGADMLRPMAIAVIGSLFMSLVMSLLATPLFFYLLVRSTPSAATMQGTTA
ncbi:MAG TPA: efflux RND transporter permease subunit, partial [Lacipirellulaceae bacterium]|nr:efflux RND transporter permease subunit [Lacipirellulaceae bacterium]